MVLFPVELCDDKTREYFTLDQRIIEPVQGVKMGWYESEKESNEILLENEFYGPCEVKSKLTCTFP